MRPLSNLSSALLALALVAGCGADSKAPQAAPNVLLITVDTLRADHLSAWGYARNTSPALDALAARSVRFARATSPAPWTLPAIASLNTGLYPASHSLEGASDALPLEAVTLAEILGAHGYATAAIIGNPLVHPRLGHGQGFDTVDMSEATGHDSISTPGITAKAKAQLADFAREKKPFFLSLLYYDPHYDWKSHGYGFAGNDTGRIGAGTEIHELRRLAEEGGLTEAERELLIARYDEEIRFTDAGIGELLDELEALGLADNTLVVFVADHGEEFLEHGWLGHTRFLFEGMVHVPLVIHDPRPGATRGVVVEERISTVAVTPTILDLVGIDPTRWAFEESSLAPALGGESLPAHVVFSSVNFEAVQKANVAKSAHLEGLLEGDIKWIRPSRGRPGKYQRYDLATDPGELSPTLFGRHAPEAADARRKLDQAWASFAERALPRRAAAYTDDELEEMQKLGYLEGE